jgi:ParB-like chromosome segregation protein Spo0J
MPSISEPAPEFKFHPLADIFPLMEGEEFDALVADIKANGLISPVVVHEDMILDGRNRYRACLEGGIEPTFRPYTGDDPAAYVISANIHRRHLTTEQKRDLIARLVKAQPEKSDRQIAKTAKVHHETVGTVRKQLEARGDVAESATRTDTKGRKQPAKKKAGRPEVADAPDELPSEPKVAEPVGEPATTTVATTGKPLSRKERQERREIRRVEIERLATRLIEVDPGSARKLYDILWEDDRYADALVEALSRVLRIDEENDEKNGAEGNGTHPQASANQRKAEHAARAAVDDGSDAGDIPACLRRSL